MKQVRNVLTILALMIATSGFAQNNMEDVVYLKNGNIYRGILIEQVPGVSYKIQINGGSIFTITVAEVEKITKEQKYNDPNTQPHDGYSMHPHFGFHQNDTTHRPPYFARKRRPFSELEFRPGVNQVGLRIVHGFKFGRFGFVGIGVGVDAVSFNNRITHGGDNLFNNSTPNNGLYIPVYIKYSGEILKKRITPYYFIEAGYAAHPNNPFVSGKGNKSWGGPTAAAGFGVRFYSRSRASFAINANMNWRSNRYRTTYSTTDVFGNPYTYTQNGMTQKVFGAVGLSIGF